ncbi:hypothetical protein BDR26DRAFT_864130 [Obelidium mucronatum]|nr:hypothetical protein BDR26DRAFT_864130 [Obelidium mucronatum]
MKPPSFNFGFHICEDIGLMMRRPNGDFCFPKQRIGPCQYLILGNHTLMMQTSGDLAGNLVLREGDNVLWTMGASGNQPKDYSFSFDTTSSISISSPSGGTSFTWSDQSLNSSSLFFCIQSTTGGLYSMPSSIVGLDLCESIEYLPAHSPIDKSNVHLLPGESILSCQYIYYQGLSLLMQRDGNLVMYIQNFSRIFTTGFNGADVEKYSLLFSGDSLSIKREDGSSLTKYPLNKPSYMFLTIGNSVRWPLFRSFPENTDDIWPSIAGIEYFGFRPRSTMDYISSPNWHGNTWIIGSGSWETRCLFRGMSVTTSTALVVSYKKIYSRRFSGIYKSVNDLRGAVVWYRSLSVEGSGEWAGNVVLRDQNQKVVWHAGFARQRFGDYTLSFKDDGELLVTDADGIARNSFRFPFSGGDALCLRVSLLGTPSGADLGIYQGPYWPKLSVHNSSSQALWVFPTQPGFYGFGGNLCRPVGTVEMVIPGMDQPLICLRPSERMEVCQYMRRGNFYFVVEETGDLAIYEGFEWDKSKRVWNAGLPQSESRAYFLDFDVNGNIGVGFRLQPMRGSSSSILFANASRLCLDSEGSLTVYQKSFLDIVWSNPRSMNQNQRNSGFTLECESLQDVGKPRFHNGTASGCILPGTTLKTCQMLKTGDYYAMLDHDSNLKIFSSNSETAASLIWSTGHQGHPPSLDYKFAFQTDGNLVLFDGQQRVISETGLLTLNKPATDLCLTPEGKLTLFDRFDVIWQSSGASGWYNGCGSIGWFVNEHLTCLKPGAMLKPCQYMRSGESYIWMDEDGALVRSIGNPSMASSREVWRSRSLGKFSYLFFSLDGYVQILNPLMDIIFFLTEDVQGANAVCIHASGEFSIFIDSERKWSYPVFGDTSDCGPVGSPWIEDTYTVGMCLPPNVSVSYCQYIRFGSKYLKLTEDANIGLYSGPIGAPDRLLFTAGGGTMDRNQDYKLTMISTDASASLTVHLRNETISTFSTNPAVLTYCISFDYISAGLVKLPKPDYLHQFDSDLSVLSTTMFYFNDGLHSFAIEIDGMICVPPGSSIGWLGIQLAGYRLWRPKNNGIFVLQNQTGNNILWYSSEEQVSVTMYNNAALQYHPNGNIEVVDVWSQNDETVLHASDVRNGSVNCFLCLHSDGYFGVYNRTNFEFLWSSQGISIGFNHNSSNESCGAVGYLADIVRKAPLDVIPLITYETVYLHNGDTGIDMEQHNEPYALYARCLSRGAVMNPCQYLRIGEYFLNMTEFSSIELRRGSPSSDLTSLMWTITSPLSGNANFQYREDGTVGIFHNRSIPGATSGDLTRGLPNSRFCLVETGDLVLLNNHTTVWSLPLKNGTFSGFGAASCASPGMASVVGHYKTSLEGEKFSCMQRGESFIPCQSLRSGDYSMNMTAEGNLFLSHQVGNKSQIIWSAQISHGIRKSPRFSFEPSGRLVFYDSLQELMSADSITNSSASQIKRSTDFCVSERGYLALLDIASENEWKRVWKNPSTNGFSGFGGDACGLVGHAITVGNESVSCMLPGDTMRPCQYMNVKDIFLSLTVNGNLKIYQGTAVRIKKDIWNTGTERLSSGAMYFKYGMDRSLRLVELDQRETNISNQTERILWTSDGTTEKPSDIASNIFSNATNLSRIGTNVQLGHTRPPINGQNRTCLLPGETLGFLAYMNLQDFYLTWTTSKNTEKIPSNLVLYRGTIRFKEQVIWTSDTPDMSIDTLLSYQKNGNIVMFVNGTVVGVTNHATMDIQSRYLCIQTDPVMNATIALYDANDVEIWRVKGSSGFGGNGQCS